MSATLIVRELPRRLGKSVASRLAAQSARRSQVYRSGDRCPSCWGEHWWIGRVTAECVRCGHAAALESAGQ